MYNMIMGKKKHSVHDGVGNGILAKFVENAYSEDGRRFGDCEVAFTHRGLGTKEKYRERRGQDWKRDMHLA
jgi:hypothetical protein